MTQLKDPHRPEISLLHTPHGILVRAQGWLAVVALAGVVALVILAGR